MKYIGWTVLALVIVGIVAPFAMAGVSIIGVPVY
jgi:hypothetical protein